VGAVDDLNALVDLGKRLLEANKERDGPIVTTGSTRRGETTWVYGRAGQPCRRCGTTIERAEQGGPTEERVRYWCRNCQT
jgi:endonuclease-8